MIRLRSIPSGIAAFLVLVSVCAQAQQPGEPGTPGGPRGGGRGGGGPGGPQLPAEQRAEVDRILAALDAETQAVAAANSNLVAATFSAPADKERISKANDVLSKARAAWAAKAAKLFAETQASEKKLSPAAIERLVQLSSGGRGGRGFGSGGFGPGRLGGPGGGPQ